MRRRLWLLGSVALLLALPLAVFTFHENRHARASWARAQKLKGERMAALARLARLSRGAATQAASDAPLPKAKKDAPRPPLTPPPIAASWRELTRRFEAGYFRTQYHSFFRRSHLAPWQAERLTTQYTESRSVIDEAENQLAVLPAGSPARAGCEQQIDAANKAFDDGARAILGDAEFVQFQRFRASLPLQSLVSDLAAEAAVVGSPLTPEQGDALSNVLVQQATTSAGTILPQQEDWEATIGAAANILSPVQLQYLRLRVEARRAVEELNQSAMASQSASAGK